MPAIRIYLSLLCCLLLSVPADAQQDNFFNTTTTNKIFFSGIVAGLNASQVDGDKYSGFHKAGLNAGIVSYARLNETWLVSIEMLYSQKGARNAQTVYSPAVGSVPEIYTLKLNYIELPLMVHIHTGYNIYLGAGLSYSRLINSDESLEGAMPVNLHKDINTFRKDDLNYLVSVQYQLYKGLSARARYQYSVSSVRDREKIPEQFGTGGQYNNLFALQLICLF
jgi:hypothetical protein